MNFSSRRYSQFLFNEKLNLNVLLLTEGTGGNAFNAGLYYNYNLLL